MLCVVCGLLVLACCSVFAGCCLMLLADVRCFLVVGCLLRGVWWLVCVVWCLFRGLLVWSLLFVVCMLLFVDC